MSAEMSSGWEHLPDVVLVHIFSYLSNQEKASMAAVCPHWSFIFHDPSLWRTQEFKFGYRTNHRIESRNALGFAAAHGSYLKTLKLLCEYPSLYLCKRFQRTVTPFLAELSRKRCQLHKFVLPELQMDRYWRQEYPREKLVISLCRFVRGQAKMYHVNLKNSQNSLSNGLRLLDALGFNGGQSIRILNMISFFHTRISVFRISRYIFNLNRFTNLRVLKTNYNYICDEVLLVLAKNCMRTLRFLYFLVTRNDPHLHVIENATWRKMKKACPNISVSIEFDTVARHDVIRSILLPDVPLKRLLLYTGLEFEEQTWQLEDTLLLIGDLYRATLVSLNLGLENGRESIDSALLQTLQKLGQLECFELHAWVEVPTVDAILRLQEEYKLGLLECHIVINQLSPEENIQLEEIVEHYEPMIETRGLDFDIRTADIASYIQDHAYED